MNQKTDPMDGVTEGKEGDARRELAGGWAAHWDSTALGEITAHPSGRPAYSDAPATSSSTE